MKLLYISFCIGLTLQLYSQELSLIDLTEWENKIELEALLEENSGIEYIDGFIYTFNDSGGEAEIYKVDPKTGKIVQTIRLKKVKNIDWEDIAFDGKYLYIGDFGNNLGERDQKYIYQFNLSKVKPDEEFVELNSKRFTFVIDEELSEGKMEPHTTNFDVEAMVYYNDQLHIFTKEWSNAKTSHYTLETFYAYQPARKVESFNTQSFITSADIIDNTLVMTGYTRDGVVYLWKFEDFKDGKFFNGTKKQYALGLSPAIGQIEGIAIDEDKIYISGEKYSNLGFESSQKLYLLSRDEIQ